MLVKISILRKIVHKFFMKNIFFFYRLFISNLNVGFGARVETRRIPKNDSVLSTGSVPKFSNFPKEISKVVLRSN